MIFKNQFQNVIQINLLWFKQIHLKNHIIPINPGGVFFKASIIEAFFSFAQAEQQREAEQLISAENLNAEAAKRYIMASLKREYASENGTELNAILPKMSPLNPHYLSKKQSVFQKMAAFVEKFKGVGGQVWFKVILN